MYKKTKFYRIAACAAIALWAIGQIILLILLANKPQYSDALNYSNFARDAVVAGSWYPTIHNFSDDYWVANTGYINFLILNLKIFGSLALVGVEQLFFNCIILWSLWKLARKFGGEKVGYVAVVLFCILPSNIMSTPVYMSDMLCMALILFSFAVCGRQWWTIVLSGALLTLGNWVRPIAPVFFPSLILYALMRREKPMRWIYYVAGMTIVYIGILGVTYNSCGHPLGGSTTKGCNMLIGNWDGADGSYTDEVFKPGNPGHPLVEPGLNTVQKDSLLTRRAIDWIIDNPGRFIALMPAKAAHLWVADIYAQKCFQPKDEGFSKVTIVGLSAIYYIVLLLCACGIWHERRRLWGMSGVLLLPVILGTGMHFLMYGGMRYHYPMMFSVIYFAAIGLENLISRHSSRAQLVKTS